MTLNIKDTETEKLAAEVAEMTGKTKEDAVREALREKKERLERAELEDLLDPEYTGDFSKTDLQVIDLSDLRGDGTG
jgi:putative transcription factor